MAFDLVFDKKAAKALAKLPNTVSVRIFHKLAAAKSDPFKHFKRLQGRLDYSLRVGDYRAIADLDRDRKQIKVTLVGHRRNIYEKS